MNAFLFLLQYVLTPLLVVTFVITIHELGHYWAGRLFNTSTKSFSIGLGDKLIGMTDKRGTVWKVSALPLGGFVSWSTEDDLKEGGRSAGVLFEHLNVWKRMFVALAGPLANFVLSIAIFAGFSMVLGNPLVKISVASIEVDSAAERAGLQVGDVFIEVNDMPANTHDVFLKEIKLSAGDPVRFLIDRGGAELNLTAIPDYAEMDNGVGIKQKTGKLGISFQPVLVDRNRLGLVEAIGHGAWKTYDSIATSVRMLTRIFSGKESVHSLSGPLGIANVVGGVTKATTEVPEISMSQQFVAVVVNMLYLSAMISVAVGFFNLLPLPILDGGQIAFGAYEAVTGRMPSEQFKLISGNLTLLFLVLMALFVTIGDFQETGLLEVFRGL